MNSGFTVTKNRISPRRRLRPSAAFGGARAILDAIFKFCLQGTPTGVTYIFILDIFELKQRFLFTLIKLNFNSVGVSSALIFIFCATSDVAGRIQRQLFFPTHRLFSGCKVATEKTSETTHSAVSPPTLTSDCFHKRKNT